MAASSSGEGPPAPDSVYTQGLVAFVNMYLSKGPPLRYLADFSCERLHQAYVVYNDKQGLGTVRAD